MKLARPTQSNVIYSIYTYIQYKQYNTQDRVVGELVDQSKF